MIVFLVQAKITPGRESEFEANWRENAVMMRENKGHHFRHLLRSKEDPSKYVIYGLWDSEEDLRAGLARAQAKEKIAQFESITVGKPQREICEFVADSQEL
jgi:heme-degrading monooxygenase HmoA